MSTSPDTNALVTLLSQWLAGHAGDDELLGALDEAREGLPPGEAEAVDELRVELREGRPRSELHRAVRETLEALALGA